MGTFADRPSELWLSQTLSVSKVRSRIPKTFAVFCLNGLSAGETLMSTEISVLEGFEAFSSMNGFCLINILDAQIMNYLNSASH